MLKKFLFAIVLFIIFTATANATSYTYEIDLDDYQFMTGPSFSLFIDNSCKPAEEIDFLNLDTPIQSANLSITHIGIFDSFFSHENWYVTAFGEYIGTLSKNPRMPFLDSQYWTTDNWDLNENIIDQINSEGWLPLLFWENTACVDIVSVDKLKLEVKTAPVSEPATMFLLSLGLILLTFIGQKNQTSVTVKK